MVGSGQDAGRDDDVGGDEHRPAGPGHDGSDGCTPSLHHQLYRNVRLECMSSSPGTTCPSCGRDDQVRGRPDVQAGDVELSCGRCGTSWWRGGRRCATCGGQDLTSRPQVMRRHSRGTQLSIVGWRDVVLCQSCDAEVIESVGTTDTPIAEDYVSAAIVDRTAPAPLSLTQDNAAVTGRPAGSPAPTRRTATDAGRTQPVRAGAPPRPTPSPRPRPPVPPATVRQALQQSQEQLAAEGTVLDPTVVLLLGTRLGPTTRLDALERSGHDPASVAAWVGSTWGPEDRSTGAGHTLITLADHWLARGWTTTDLAAVLRPQEHA
jgi:hypothetical protein